MHPLPLEDDEVGPAKLIPRLPGEPVRIVVTCYEGASGGRPVAAVTREFIPPSFCSNENARLPRPRRTLFALVCGGVGAVVASEIVPVLTIGFWRVAYAQDFAISGYVGIGGDPATEALLSSRIAAAPTAALSYRVMYALGNAQGKAYAVQGKLGVPAGSFAAARLGPHLARRATPHSRVLTPPPRAARAFRVLRLPVRQLSAWSVKRGGAVARVTRQQVARAFVCFLPGWSLTWCVPCAAAPAGIRALTCPHGAARNLPQSPHRPPRRPADVACRRGSVLFPPGRYLLRSVRHGSGGVAAVHARACAFARPPQAARTAREAWIA